MSTKKYRKIGKQLQDARIKKGWSLEEVQLKLQISKRYLMAIEAGENEDLPGEYYTQSLIKQYTNLLDLNIGSQAMKNEPKSIQEWRREHAETIPQSRTEDHQKKTVFQAMIQHHPWFMGIVLVVVIWLLVWGALNDTFSKTKSSFKVQEHTKVVDKTQKKHAKKRSSNSESSSNDVNAKKVQVENSDGIIKVTLGSALDTTDLMVQTDNQSWDTLTQTKPEEKTIWKGLVEADQNKTLSLERGATYKLTFGDLTGLSVTVDGQTVNATSSTSYTIEVN